MDKVTFARHVLFLASLMLGLGQTANARGLDVPMDRELVSVLLRFGFQDTEPSTWKGTYRVTDGRIVATAGWRFAGADYATTSAFQFNVRRFYPRFWNRRGRKVQELTVEPNGVVLTLADVSAQTILDVSTSRGDFRVPIGTLGYSPPRKVVDRTVEYQRVPTSRQIVQAPTEDGYPSAVAGPDGQLSVAYIAFTHGKGFEKRPVIETVPDDFSFLAKPTGGDQILFTESQNGQWTEPEALTEPGGDLFGTALARDGQNRIWAFWSANVDGNWDLYGKVRSRGQWSETIRITRASGSDFHHVATTDSLGHVWLAWQSFGKTNSDIFAACQDGDRFGAPMAVATSSANDWKPAIAASADGQVAVAWDSYERGNYDVLARVWRTGQWGDVHVIGGTVQNEARASIAFDRQNRLWIAHEISPEGWGKDSGPYDQSPKRTALYKQRAVSVKILDGSTLYAPASDVNRALPLPTGGPRWPKSGDAVKAAAPQLAIDAGGRVWLSARIRLTRFDSAVGGTWVSFLTTLDTDKWRTAFVVPETDGFLHESPVLVPASGSGLQIVSVSDGRFRSAAVFGPGQKKGRPQNQQTPPASTRVYDTYPDTLFNKEIAVADTGRGDKPDAPYKLVKDSAATRAEPTRAARNESAQIAAMRDYRADVAGQSLRIVRGEFHRHTEISSDGGGDGTIFDMWRYALDMAALDWIGCGDHDNGNGREFSWWFTQKTTSLLTVPGAFTPMYTYERSCTYPDGHRNAVFVQRGIRPLGRLQNGRGKAMDNLPASAPRPNTPDTLMFYKYLRQFDGVCASHTSGTDMGTDWRDNDPKVEPIVEIYQGDRQSYERPGAPRSNSADYSLGGWRPYGFVSLALMKGYRLGFQSSSDHISTHMSYCNVWVEEPTRQAILDGMRRRHVYGATDNIIADVRCGEHFMGDEFTIKKPPTFRVKLIGTAPFAEVVIVKDNEYVYSASPQKAAVDFTWTDTAAQPGKTSYYYVRGTQVGQSTEKTVRSASGERVGLELNNGEIVWVSPMWITYTP